MYKVNDAKSQALLAGLRADPETPVSIADFNSVIKSSGVEAQMSAGRFSLTYNFNLRDFGINVDSLNTKEFVDTHVSGNTLRILPEDLEARLKREYDAGRYCIKKYSIFDGKFIPISAVEELKKEFYTHRQAYFDTRDEILNRYFEIIGDFRTSLINMLEELGVEPDKRKNIQEAVFNRIPTSKEYEGSFYYDLKLKAFPVVEMVDGFDAGLQQDIADSTEDELLRVAYGSIAHCLGECVSTCNRIINGVVKESFTFSMGKTKVSLEKLEKNLRTRNLFKNPEISDISDMISEAAELDDPDDLCFVAERIEGRIYRYIKDVNLEIPEDFVVPVSKLKVI